MLSDHKLQKYTIHEGFSVMTWNVLTQCKLYKNYYNNGFGKIESDECYLARLDKIVEEILLQDVKIIALQEASNHLFSKISTALPSHWIIYHTGDLITAFDGNCMEVEVLNNIQINLGHQQRITGFHIKNDVMEMDFFNQHFKWHEPGSEHYNQTVQILQNLVDIYDKSIITGDFNLNIMEVGLKNCNLYTELDSTICGRLVNQVFTQEYETCDGFIVVT